MKKLYPFMLIACFTLSTFAQKDDILDNGDLIFYYDFEEAQNNKVKDISDNNFDGNYDDIKDDKAESFSGKAFEFADTDSSKIWIDYDEDHSPNEVTLMAWIYAESDGGDDKRMEIIEKTPCYWINRRNGKIEGNEAEWGKIRGGVFCSQEEGGNVTWRYLDSQEAIPLKEWHHVAFTYDTETMKMYIDGEFSSEGAANGDIYPYIRKNNVPIVIGSRANTNDDEFNGTFSAHWDGKIDEMILLGTTLDDDDIADYYASVNPTDIPYTLRKNDFTIYPNPVTNEGMVYTGDIDNNHLKVIITNVSGQVVYTNNINSAYTYFNASDIGPTGIYFVELRDESNSLSVTKKLIVK